MDIPLKVKIIKVMYINKTSKTTVSGTFMRKTCEH